MATAITSSYTFSVVVITSRSKGAIRGFILSERVHYGSMLDEGEKELKKQAQHRQISIRYNDECLSPLNKSWCCDIHSGFLRVFKRNKGRKPKFSPFFLLFYSISKTFFFFLLFLFFTSLDTQGTWTIIGSHGFSKAKARKGRRVRWRWRRRSWSMCENDTWTALRVRCYQWNEKSLKTHLKLREDFSSFSFAFNISPRGTFFICSKYVTIFTYYSLIATNQFGNRRGKERDELAVLLLLDGWGQMMKEEHRGNAGETVKGARGCEWVKKNNPHRT